MKLWQKSGTSIDELVEKFTVGNDKIFDIHLARYDILGSIAHVRMLGEVGLMSKDEAHQAIDGLHQILQTVTDGTFVLEDGVEDVHSQVEFLLVQKIGETGKKIHSGRSRNDQIAVDIKLYLRDQIQELKSHVSALFELLIQSSEKYKNHSLPGYTHLQLAMPSSFGLWFGAYAEALIDDLEILLAAHRIVNKNPLGSGAGYGSTFPLNRQMTTDELQFDTMNYNSVYAQMTRGKAEKATATALSYLAFTLGKLAMDCCVYMNQNFGFISFPDNLTTGSSIMPHKKNPDVFELIRGKCNRIQALPNEFSLLMANLPSGYHRDMQLTKEMLFPAIEEMKSCLTMTVLMLENIHVRENILEDEKYTLLFTVDSVNEWVKQGVSFRDAYKIVGDSVQAGTYQKPSSSDTSYTPHQGSIHKLCNEEIREEMNKVLARFA